MTIFSWAFPVQYTPHLLRCSSELIGKLPTLVELASGLTPKNKSQSTDETHMKKVQLNKQGVTHSVVNIVRSIYRIRRSSLIIPQKSTAIISVSNNLDYV